MKTNDEVSDYLNGMTDCINGVDHKPGNSEEYNDGYNYQYQHEQNLTNLCERQDEQE